MRFERLREHAEQVEIRTMCEVLDVSRAGYYAWLKRSTSDRQQADDLLDEQIPQVFAESCETYGSPRVFSALRRRGVNCGENRVAHRMRKKRLISMRRRKYCPQSTDSNHDLPVAENLLEQEFSATGPNQRWDGDITYIWTAQGWLYLAVILDLFSPRVVGWATSFAPKADLACRAMEMAVVRRGRPQDLVHHSDRGIQYASTKFRPTLSAFGIAPSMSRKGNCYDNSVAESFFDTLKVELVHRYKFATRTVARMLLIDYLGEFDNLNRIYSTLGCFNPAEYKKLMEDEELIAGQQKSRVH